MHAHRDDTQTQSDNTRFIRASMAVDLLTREEEINLAKAWQDKGDEKSLHTLINAHSRLAIAMATKFRGYGLPLSDMIQEGHIGLLQAASKFDVKREVRFSTYASWWIRAAMQDYILRNWSIVRSGTTATQKALFFNLRRLRARIEGRERAKGYMGPVYLTNEAQAEIADALKVKQKDVAWMDMRLAAGDQSLAAPIAAEGNVSVGDFLVDEAPTPEEQVMKNHDAAKQHYWLMQVIGCLDKREQAIIKSRHLKNSGATLEDLGKKLRISKERVRQLESRALAKLKKILLCHKGLDACACAA